MKNPNFSEILLGKIVFFTQIHDPQISNQIDAAVIRTLVIDNWSVKARGGNCLLLPVSSYAYDDDVDDDVIVCPSRKRNLLFKEDAIFVAFVVSTRIGNTRLIVHQKTTSRSAVDLKRTHFTPYAPICNGPL